MFNNSACLDTASGGKDLRTAVICLIGQVLVTKLLY